MRNPFDWARDQVEEVTDLVGDGYEGVADWAGDQVEGASDWVGDQVGGEWDQQIDQWGQDANQHLDEFGQNVNQGFDLVGQNVNQDPDELGGDANQGLFEGVTDWAGDAVEGVTDWAGDRVEGASNWVGDQVEGASDWAGNGVGGEWGQQIDQWGQDANQSLGEFGQDANQGLDEFGQIAGKGLDEFGQIANQVYDLGWDQIVDQAVGGVSDLAQDAADLVDGVPVLEQVADVAADAVGVYAEFQGGIYKGAGTMVDGVVQMVSNPLDTAAGLLTMAEHVPGLPVNPLKAVHGLYDMAAGNRSMEEVANDVLNPLESAKDDAAFWGDVAGHIVEPYQQAIEEGNYAEAIGRGVFDIGTIVATGGSGAAVGGAAGAGRVASVAGTAARTAEVGEAGAVVARTAEAAEAAGAVARMAEGGGAMGTPAAFGARGTPVPRAQADEFGTHVGAVSGRPFDPDAIGVPIRELSTERVQVKANGIDVVERHLSRFGDDEQNAAQVQRLRDIDAGEIEATPADLNFYTHEMREYVRYRSLGHESGVPVDADAAHSLWNNTHTATLEDYGLKGKPDELYHPSTDPTTR